MCNSDDKCNCNWAWDQGPKIFLPLSVFVTSVCEVSIVCYYKNFQQLLMENRVPALGGERVFRAQKKPKTIYGTVK